MNWRAQAACAGADLALFMPAGSDPFPIVTETAQRFCLGCEVREICGREADRRRDTGFRGGTWRSGTTNKYRRYPLLAGVELEPLTPRPSGVRLDRMVAS